MQAQYGLGAELTFTPDNSSYFAGREVSSECDHADSLTKVLMPEEMISISGEPNRVVLTVALLAVLAALLAPLLICEGNNSHWVRNGMLK